MEESGVRSQEGRKKKEEEELELKEKVFITNYPDMILLTAPE
ncbi:MULTISPECIES: hypothetical protein [Okeania]|nr:MULTISPECIES: hypothetical protein [Okeania]